jgi:hypothetical protein
MITTLPSCLYELTALSAFLVRLRTILPFVLHIAFVQSMAFLSNLYIQDWHFSRVRAIDRALM